jgi:hypothetical protein
MTRVRSALLVTVLAVALVLAGAATAFAARPVAANNTAPAAFAPVQNCSCHSQFINQWQQSLHAQALSDPLFQAKLAEGNTATGGAIGPFCLKCHGPVATMTGQLGTTDKKSAAAQAMPCSFCHQAVGASAPTNNVSLLIDPSGIYRAQIATPTAPHPVAVSPFHATSQICGSCHNVSHPGNGLPIEATYTEWQNSPQGKAGITCQDCHMSAAPGQIGPSMGWAAGGGAYRPIYQMTFMGAQVALGNPVLAEGMLKNAATIELEGPAMLEGAKSTSATVTITNTGAGHYLPTGLTEVREMWLEVDLVNPDGGVTPLGKHVYGTVLKNAAGKFPVQMWEATGVQSDDRIAPKGTSVTSFKIQFPDSGKQYGVLRARLLYRSTDDALAKKAKVENPTTVMAESSQPIFANPAGRKQYTAVALAQVSSSPLMPLVFAILGILLSVALVVFFLWRARDKEPYGPLPDPDKSSKGSSDKQDKPKKDADKNDAADTGTQPTDATVVDEPVGESKPNGAAE